MTIYYTNEGNQKDGFGAQYQRIVYTILYCKLHKLNFIYTPFTSMEHNYDNDKIFIQKKENLINLINHYPIITYEIENNNKINILHFNEIRYYIEDNLTYILKSNEINEIRNIFWSNKNKNNFFNKNINVAIHIRRPNIHDIRIDGSDTPDTYYLNIINTIYNNNINLLSDNNKLIFNIYSQGDIDSFKLYKEFIDNNTKNTEIIFNINESIEKTFIEMVKSDILVLSRSSFSYVAALLNEGTIYYQQFWHKPSNDWIIIN